MIKKGDIVIRTYETYASHDVMHGAVKGDIFIAFKDSSNFIGYYSEISGSTCRQAHRMEKIAYKRGLRNVNNISWNTPDKPHFAVSIGHSFGALDDTLKHDAYREICEYLNFPSQYGNYDNCTYAGYKNGSSRTWTHSPDFDGMKFESVVKFVDYVLENWMIIDLPKKEAEPANNGLPILDLDTDKSKDYCVYLPNKVHHTRYKEICEKGNIPYLEWSEYFNYYGVYGGKTIRLGVMFGKHPYKNYDYFKGDRPDVRFGRKNEPKIDQDDLCKFCEDNIIGGSGNSSMYQCEGSRCEEAKEAYMDSNEEPKEPHISDYLGRSFTVGSHTKIYTLAAITCSSGNRVEVRWKDTENTDNSNAYYDVSEVLRLFKSGGWVLALLKKKTIINNNQLKTSKKDEKLSRKTSKPSERRSYHGTRQTTKRRKPNSTTERCTGLEEIPGKTQERVREALRSKRDRLRSNPKLSGRYNEDS